MRLLHVPAWQAALLDTLAWGVWSVAVGLAASRLPVAWLARETWLTRPRRFERGGRLYERFAVRRWKDRLPEAGTAFGGTSKRSTGGRDTAALERFAAETRRAELVHWAVPAALPAFALWNPPLLLAAMAAYAVAANLPFVVVQRYNRARIGRILAARRDPAVPGVRA